MNLIQKSITGQVIVKVYGDVTTDIEITDIGTAKGSSEENVNIAIEVK
jgi:hypothetical protein